MPRIGLHWGMKMVATMALAGCGERGADRARTDSAAPAAEEISALPTVSWTLTAPTSWDERVVIADDPEGIERLREQGIRSARLFNYVPYDTAIVPQALLGVYVYDSTAWARLEREQGPPQGELLQRRPGVAYIVSFPQSNPFAEGGRDFAEFARRSVDRAFVDTAFRVVEKGASSGGEGGR